MPSPRLRRHASLAFLVLGLLGGGLLWRARVGTAVGPTAPEQLSSSAMDSGPTVESSSSPPVASGIPTASHRPPPPAPAYLREVFPSLTEDVVDWRRFRPETLAVRLSPGLVASFRIVEVDEGTHRTVITARLDQDEAAASSDLAGVFLVGTANRADTWRAVVAFTGMEYHIDVEAGRASVTEAPMEDFHCEPEIPRVLAEDEWPPVSAPDPLAADGDPLIVDVLFLYDAQALADQEGRTHAIDADCANYIAQSNAVLSNSRISRFRWRYLGAVQTPATSTNSSLLDDLRALRTGGALASFVEQLKVQRRVDQFVYLVGGVKTGGVGVAAGSPPFLHSAVNYPYPTTSAGVRSSTRTSFIVVCHELGHNFGCRHDRADPASTANAAPGAYDFGYRFSDSSTGGPIPYGTVMAIGAVRVPYFSNPDVTYREHALGVPIGLPEAAFNAWALAQRSPVIAGASDATGLPVITQHPESVTVAPGQSVTLRVAAAGDGIVYVWSKDRTPIPGSEGATFTISNASASSAGVYQAAALNAVGITPSNQAVVTVTNASPPPPPPGSGGGGNGGGGGGGFLGAGWSLGVFLAAGLRLALVRRREPRSTH